MVPSVPGPSYPLKSEQKTHTCSENVEKKKSQNGLRMYPKLLPHQLRPISTYPNPPISHIGKIENCVFFVIFRYFLGPEEYACAHARVRSGWRRLSGAHAASAELGKLSWPAAQQRGLHGNTPYMRWRVWTEVAAML